MSNYLDIVLIVVFTLVQWRITRLVLARIPGPGARAGVYAFNIAVALAYVFAQPWAVMQSPLPPQPSMVLGAFALAYLMTATGALGLYTVTIPVRRMIHADTNPARRKVLHLGGNALLAAPFAVMGYGALIQRTDFHVREVDLPVPGLPADLDGLRILQLSDIHLSAFLSEAEFARVIDASLELRPHLAAITGDLISGPQDPLDACIRQLARLKADAGLFACMGNHERFAKVEDYAERACAARGIRFLRGHAQALRFGNATLNLAGCDYASHWERSHYLKGMDRLIEPGAFNVLLQHNPDVFPVAARQGYNLLLAGHTHGGQVTLEILDQQINPARVYTPFVYGLYREGRASAYVTRGIGTIGVPARIGAPPEITLLRLGKA
ncbi:MAG: metallophosphoesterase [Acidobacteria bacterium]|nr:metallophosphoesterase [Acidobacteriota bacterium]